MSFFASSERLTFYPVSVSLVKKQVNRTNRNSPLGLGCNWFLDHSVTVKFPPGFEILKKVETGGGGKQLGVLESAVLECKKREVNTPELTAALDLLEPHIQPAWLIPQFRRNLGTSRRSAASVSRYLSGDPRLSQRTCRQKDGCPSAEVSRDSRHGREG